MTTGATGSSPTATARSPRCRSPRGPCSSTSTSASGPAGISSPPTRAVRVSRRCATASTGTTATRRSRFRTPVGSNGAIYFSYQRSRPDERGISGNGPHERSLTSRLYAYHLHGKHRLRHVKAPAEVLSVGRDRQVTFFATTTNIFATVGGRAAIIRDDTLGGP